MKHLLFTTFLFLTTILMAQPDEDAVNDPYAPAWAEIDSLLQNGLPRSAHDALQTLWGLVQEDFFGDPTLLPHWIKVKIATLEVGKQLEENGDWLAIRRLEEITRLAGEPEKSIYRSYLAEQYYRYWQRNRWQLQNATTRVDSEKGEDATTWSQADLLEHITSLYLASVELPMTRTIDIGSIQPLLATGDKGHQLLPTVYDLLLHRALDYFRNNDAFLNEPAYDPALNKIELLGTIEEFVDFELPSEEPASSYQATLSLLQEALRWSAAERANTEAHLDLNLSRLEIVYAQLEQLNKHEAYEEALLRLADVYQETEFASLLQAKLMRYYYERGAYYGTDDPATADLRWNFRKAKELAEDIQRRYPESTASQDAANIIALVNRPSLSLRTEQVQIPKQAALAQLSFQNVDQVYLRLVPVEITANPEQNRETLLRTLLKRKVSKDWSVQLPDAGDYRLHTTELVVPALAAGKYYLIASADSSFPIDQEGKTVLMEYWVSNLATAFEADVAEGEIALMIMDRSSGAPIAGAEVTVWEYERRNRANRQPKLIMRESLQSDPYGRILLREKNANGLVFQVKNGKDQLFLRESQYLNVQTSSTPPRTKMLFFTDRGIYRPGQTLYFKALLLWEDSQIPSLVANEQVEISLMNANRQEVEKIQLTTNQYGSVSGQFTLPETGLLGRMSFYAQPGSNWHYFRVEEYKRPRFEVSLDPLKEEAALNDTIQVEGSAEMYAGPAVAEAEVKYRVTRMVSYPWYRSWYRMPFRPAQEYTIVSGSTVTDEQGRFQFSFEAQADADPSSEVFPLYTFKLEVEVVDGTGETRMATKQINLTKYPFNLQLSTANTQDRNKPLVLALGCRNLEGQELAQQVQVLVQRRRTPSQTYSERYWPFPDTVTLNERSFRKNLPNYAFDKEELKQYWPVAETRWKKELLLQGTDTLELSVQDWPVGHYLAELLVLTPEGNTLRTRTEFSLHDWDQQEFAVGQPLYLRSEQNSLEPGETARLQLGQMNGPEKVWMQWRNRDGRLSKTWATTNETYSRLVEEGDRAGLVWQGFYLWQNRKYEVQQYYAVPWSNKKLQIEFETFRSKLYPDQEEEWTIRIDGPDQEVASAEVLASMYDASLDQILPFQWQLHPYRAGVSRISFWTPGFRLQDRYIAIPGAYVQTRFLEKVYPQLYHANQFTAGRGGDVPRTYSAATPAPMMADGMAQTEGAGNVNKLPTRNINGLAASAAGVRSEGGAPEAEPGNEGDNAPVPAPTKVRTNMAETAFFLPILRTDEDGRVSFKFRSPEALTQWKLQVLAHDQQLAYALDSRSLVTQKELMILPNAPRFLREGDRVILTAKVSNLSDQVLSGKATLELFDLDGEQDLAEGYQLKPLIDVFELEAQTSQTVSWEIEVPKDAVGTLGYRVIARSGSFADGEEAALPVLTNRVLITEAQPLFVPGRKTARFSLPGLEAADSEQDHHSYELHITSNPAWEAVKALPYLLEYPYDCTEQIVNRLFANTISRAVLDNYPQAEEVFESWRRSADGLKSPLALNEGLKSATLEETPWVMDAEAEELQRKRIAMLFDVDRLDTEWTVGVSKLLQRQQRAGGFSWFPSGRENVYMTQYVAEQLSHLRDMASVDFDLFNLTNALNRAVKFCDNHYQTRYQAWKEDERKGFASGPQLVHYLYMRSFNEQVQLPQSATEMWDYAWEKTSKEWLTYGLFEQVLLGYAAARSVSPRLAEQIIASLRERSFQSAEMGRYWQQNYGYYWYQNPIETQAKMIEFFQLMDASETELSEMKIWLLRHKETNRWETTKATAAAVFALLTSGEDWLGETTPLSVSYPSLSEAEYESRISTAQENAEAGTGAYKVRWEASEVVPQLSELSLQNQTAAPAWGAMYWQYFQTIEEVQESEDHGLTVERKLYRKVDEGEGYRLVPLDQSPETGDRITVRLVIRADRDFEFVHLKDLRASGLEPIEQLSQYRYQGGLGYYQQSTDLGTHFFFDYLRKGEYVLEFDLRVFHAGDFSGGLSTIQCMYAPKFTSRSEGVRLKVE